MITINKAKNELEIFIDSLEGDYPIDECGILFNEFKELFCDDSFNLLNVCPLKRGVYESIYKKIRTPKGSRIFFKKINEYIINNFTLNAKFCPYCGKGPLISFHENNNRRSLFQFDHFFLKSEYPFGAINFYNLILSCNACNHYKHNKNLINNLKNGEKIFHPYFGELSWDGTKITYAIKKNFNSETSFSNDFSAFTSDYSGAFAIAKKYFHDTETYNTFRFLLETQEKIKAEMSILGKDFEQAKDYFLNNYYPKNEKDILKYANGKLKRDIIKNLKPYLK